MEQHVKRVAAIQSRVLDFHSRGKQYRIYHGSTSTTRKTVLSRDSTIDTSQLTNITIDVEKRLARIEPNVSMERLLDTCLAVGLMPPVVMEFPAITVGGGFAGTAGESGSFRHGLFDRTISRIEIVLASGELVEASKDVRPDLFHAAAGSFGTMGVITLLEMPLLEAKPFVELTYTRVEGIKDAISIIESLTADTSVDYLEGIMFGLTSGLIISGELINAPLPHQPSHRFTRPRDPWFYLRAQEFHSSTSPSTPDFVPLKDYLFRYDRGAFWAGRYAFKYFLTPFNALTRWALDAFMHTSVMYTALHNSGLAAQYIVQDIGFPYATAAEFVTHLDSTCGFYPLWLCPLNMLDETLSLCPKNKAAFAPTARSRSMMLNIGLWGPGPSNYDQFIALNRSLEQKTADLGGLKCFYAQAYDTEEEFWRLYDRRWYDGVRERYAATGLPTVYEKVCAAVLAWRAERDLGWREWGWRRIGECWPVRGVYGVLGLVVGRDRLLR